MNGGSKVVHAVTPKARLFVTAAIAEMTFSASVDGCEAPSPDATYHEWIIKWPLGSRSNSRGMALLVYIVASEVVGFHR